MFYFFLFFHCVSYARTTLRSCCAWAYIKCTIDSGVGPPANTVASVGVARCTHVKRIQPATRCYRAPKIAAVAAGLFPCAPEVKGSSNRVVARGRAARVGRSTRCEGGGVGREAHSLENAFRAAAAAADRPSKNTTCIILLM